MFLKRSCRMSSTFGIFFVLNFSETVETKLPGVIPNKMKFTCILLALLRKSLIINGAGEGNRTLVCSLEGCRSTIELHPHRIPQSLTNCDAGNHTVLASLVNPRFSRIASCPNSQCIAARDHGIKSSRCHSLRGADGGHSAL